MSKTNKSVTYELIYLKVQTIGQSYPHVKKQQGHFKILCPNTTELLQNQPPTALGQHNSRYL